VRFELDRRSSLLLALGLGSEGVYAGYFVRQFPLLRYYQQDTDIGYITGYTHAGFAGFVGALTVLFVLFATAWWLVRPRLSDGPTTLGAGTGARPSHPPPEQPEVERREGRRLWLILGFGGLFAATMAFVYPITAIDPFAYIAQSRILVEYHHNPLTTPPSAFPGDSVMLLTDGWYRSGAPYGPLGILVDALPTLLVGKNLLANLLLLKLTFSALALTCAYLAFRLAKAVDPGYALGAALLVAWNPMVLVEVSGNGHNDVVMLLAAMLGLLAMAKERLVIGAALVAASALVKYSTGLLFPLVVLYGLSHQQTTRGRITYAVTAVGGSLVLVALVYAPFWRGPYTLRDLFQSLGYSVSFGRLLVDLLPGRISVNAGGLVGWVLFVAVYNYAIWLAPGRIGDLLRACFMALFGFVALAINNFQVWYGLWPVLIAAALAYAPEGPTAILLAYGASLPAAFRPYLYSWLGGVTHPGTFRFVDEISYLASFVPAALLFVVLLAAHQAISYGPRAVSHE
jgi:hypothetical protein